MAKMLLPFHKKCGPKMELHYSKPKRRTACLIMHPHMLLSSGQSHEAQECPHAGNQSLLRGYRMERLELNEPVPSTSTSSAAACQLASHTVQQATTKGQRKWPLAQEQGELVSRGWGSFVKVGCTVVHPLTFPIGHGSEQRQVHCILSIYPPRESNNVTETTPAVALTGALFARGVGRHKRCPLHFVGGISFSKEPLGGEMGGPLHCSDRRRCLDRPAQCR